MCKVLCTPSVTVRQHWKVRKKELWLYYRASASRMMLVIRYFAKAELTASKRKLLRMVLAIVLISVGFKMSKQDLTASHTHPSLDTGQIKRASSPPPQPAGMQGSGMAMSNCPALGSNSPSLTREATLGVSSALLGFLCQGRKICKVALSWVSNSSSTGKGSRAVLCLRWEEGGDPTLPGG